MKAKMKTLYLSRIALNLLRTVLRRIHRCVAMTLRPDVVWSPFPPSSASAPRRHASASPRRSATRCGIGEFLADSFTLRTPLTRRRDPCRDLAWLVDTQSTRQGEAP
jgi:hypothetical protein